MTWKRSFSFPLLILFVTSELAQGTFQKTLTSNLINAIVLLFTAFPLFHLCQIRFPFRSLRIPVESAIILGGYHLCLDNLIATNSILFTK